DARLSLRRSSAILFRRFALRFQQSFPRRKPAAFRDNSLPGSGRSGGNSAVPNCPSGIPRLPTGKCNESAHGDCPFRHEAARPLPRRYPWHPVFFRASSSARHLRPDEWKPPLSISRRPADLLQCRPCSFSATLAVHALRSAAHPRTEFRRVRSNPAKPPDRRAARSPSVPAIEIENKLYRLAAAAWRNSPPCLLPPDSPGLL